MTEEGIHIIIAVIKQYPMWLLMVPLENYYNVNEASRCLRVHPETVKRLCRQGDVPAIKFHNTWLISQEDLDSFAGTYVPTRGARRRLI